MAISTIRNYNLFKIDLLFTFIYRLLPQKPHSQEEFSMLNKERLKNVFYDMVKIYSPSKGEGEICAWVMDYLRARGLEPEIDEAGKAYGGNGLNDDSLRHFTNYDPIYEKDKKGWLKLYVPARTALVLRKDKE